MERYCASLVRGGPLALAGTKQLLRRTRAETIRADLADLAQRSAGYFKSAEGREGVAAAREKRDRRLGPGPITWSGPAHSQGRQALVV